MLNIFIYLPPLCIFGKKVHLVSWVSSQSVFSRTLPHGHWVCQKKHQDWRLISPNMR